MPKSTSATSTAAPTVTPAMIGVFEDEEVADSAGGPTWGGFVGGGKAGVEELQPRT